MTCVLIKLKTNRSMAKQTRIKLG